MGISLSFLMLMGALISVSVCCATIAGQGADSTVTADSAAAAPTENPHITIGLENNRTIHATEVKPEPMGYVEVITVGGDSEHIATYKIRTILDESGIDRTKEVFDRRRALVLGGPLPNDPTRWRSFRFRGGPKSVCGSFAITEFAYMWRLDRGTDVVSDQHWYASFDGGMAKNVGARSALGGTLFMGADGDRFQFGVRGRYRHWLSHAIGVDFSPGLVLLADEEGNKKFQSPGFIAQAGINVADQVAVTTQVFSIRRRGYFNATESETAWHGGVKLGSHLGITGLFVATIGVVAALGSLSGF